LFFHILLIFEASIFGCAMIINVFIIKTPFFMLAYASCLQKELYNKKFVYASKVILENKGLKGTIFYKLT
ncbi:MAG: hypothetical protein ACRDDY_01050, partial [Clostridium sp.]|uniref:hypothetical protein n=1 Tax=Clostridium sp. TaxID=1506 RepID=UPI003EE45646